MTLIYWTDFSAFDIDLFFSICHPHLTPQIVKKQMKYKNKESAVSFLLGRLLLWYGTIDLLGKSTPLTLCFTKNEKPYFEQGPFFNISHSGNYVACAINSKYNIGMDLENTKPICYTEFQDYFTLPEWDYIVDSPSPTQTFYKLWTRKEAVIKEDGKGLGIPLNSFSTLEDRLYFNSKHFLFEELDFSSEYMGHLVVMSESDFSSNSSEHISHFIPIEQLLIKLKTVPFLLSDLN
ncbi:hypothetical protein D1631_12895 [Chryseobacterium nematophagum]|uniref:4'-phosphopantetheinyl transferase domain-containing protein n=2 Tax=Chryseobacterium nematophagum TaxID=2305228 RepID=A0A3M7THK4_9FLAO|nr:hypothetical protein D1631_12895 [Chryseobacterium nematophagum]